MAWNPYTDQMNRSYSGILTTLFPEQTKTIPRIILWRIVFLLDLILGVAGAVYFGLFQPDVRASGLLAVAVIGVFWLQGKVWYAIVHAIEKNN